MQVESNKTFEVGDVVELKSGGPKMTIRDTSSGVIACEWFLNGEVRKAAFEPKTLKSA